MHADRAVGAIVDDDHEQIAAVLDGRCEFLAVHQEIAVARQCHDHPAGAAERRGDRGGDAIAHRAGGRRELCAGAGIGPVAMPPAREVSGAVADDRVLGQRGAHCGDAGAEIHCDALARLGGRPGVVRIVRLEIVRVRGAVYQRQRLGEFGHRGADREIGAVRHAQFGRIGVNVDQALTGVFRSDQRIAVGGRLAQSRADHQQQIGRLHARDERWVGAVAEVAGIGRAIVGHGILAAEGGDERHARAIGPGGDILPRSRIPASAADDRDGGFRGGEEIGELLHRLRIGRLADAFDARAIDRHDFVEQHVLGQCEDDRAGAAVHRDGVGARDIFGDAARIVDPRGPFGERGEHRGEVDFLERLAIAGAAIDIADEEDHRLRILAGHMDADRRVGGAGAARDEGDAGAVRERAIGAGHERDAAFLAARDDVDRGRIDERVEHGEEAFAGHGEDPVAALRHELIDEDAAAGAGLGFGLSHAAWLSRTGGDGEGVVAGGSFAGKAN